MDKDKLLRQDGVLWSVEAPYTNSVHPICPVHYLQMSPFYGSSHSRTLVCDDCSNSYPLPREFYLQKEYILKKIASKKFKTMKVINLDDEAVPLAETTLNPADDKFFLTASLVKSKVGKRVVVYAGEKGRAEKTQVFIEPDIKRVAFDQKDLHPKDVFLKLEATFDDGSKGSIEK